MANIVGNELYEKLKKLPTEKLNQVMQKPAGFTEEGVRMVEQILRERDGLAIPAAAKVELANEVGRPVQPTTPAAVSTPVPVLPSVPLQQPVAEPQEPVGNDHGRSRIPMLKTGVTLFSVLIPVCIFYLSYYLYQHAQTANDVLLAAKGTPREDGLSLEMILFLFVLGVVCFVIGMFFNAVGRAFTRVYVNSVNNARCNNEMLALLRSMADHDSNRQ